MVDFSSFSRDYVKKWSAKGIQVVAWTVNTFDEKSAKKNIELAENFIQESKKFLPEDIEII